MQDFFRRRSEFADRFPDLRSILVLSVPYDDAPGNRPSGPPDPARPAAGRVARYAKGRDYHREIRKKLKLLTQTIHSLAGAQTRVIATVDTSAVQERVLAESAGLGFFGKNTCLIRPKGGSYFFLCALLTDLDLVSDPPIQWDCGSCTLCIEACPTQALTQPYQLDAGRCISALTIELRGPVPEPIRPKMGNWVFGCDICQEVCPYNHGPGAGEESLIPLADLLSLRTEAQFLDQFAGTALTRAKREGLLRNAAIAAGNSKDSTLIPALQETLAQDSSAVVREHAAWALNQLKATP